VPRLQQRREHNAERQPPANAQIRTAPLARRLRVEGNPLYLNDPRRLALLPRQPPARDGQAQHKVIMRATARAERGATGVRNGGGKGLQLGDQRRGIKAVAKTF
jgi:hypothetical protein